jgi:hypothetical protein
VELYLDEHLNGFDISRARERGNRCAAYFPYRVGNWRALWHWLRALCVVRRGRNLVGFYRRVGRVIWSFGRILLVRQLAPPQHHVALSTLIKPFDRTDTKIGIVCNPTVLHAINLAKHARIGCLARRDYDECVV